MVHQSSNLSVNIKNDLIYLFVGFGEKDSLSGKQTVYASEKLKFFLSEGRYVLRVKVRWVDNRSHDFTLNTFSPFPIEIKKAQKSAYPNFLKNVYLEIAKKSNEKFCLSNNCQFESSWAGSHLWLYLANKGETTWSLEIIFDKLSNLKLCKSHRITDNIFSFILKPNEQTIVYVKRLNNDLCQLSWKFEQSWE